MPAASNQHARGQMYRSPRGLGDISDSQGLEFLDQPWYYEIDDSLSQMTASTSYSRGDESEFVSAMSQFEKTYKVGQQTLLQFMRSYSLHIIVAVILYTFLFEVAVRLPFLLALAFAIPSIHMLLVQDKPESVDNTHKNDSEALYRRLSIFSVVPGEPVAQYKTTETLHPVGVTFPGLTFFSPSTWFPRATDPSDFRYRRQRLHTTFWESAYQPRRTFLEALEDTVPRVLESWTRFIIRTILYQITSRILIFVIERTYEVVIGEEMNVDTYIMNVMRFYWDWAAGMSWLASYGMKWAISKLVMLLGQLSIWLGRQATMITGAMHETKLEYKDLNTVQF